VLFRKRLQLRFKFLFILKGFKNSQEQIVGGLAQEVLHFFLHSTKELRQLGRAGSGLLFLINLIRFELRQILLLIFPTPLIFCRGGPRCVLESFLWRNLGLGGMTAAKSPFPRTTRHFSYLIPKKAVSTYGPHGLSLL
jgi:hypothetical protein